MTKEGILNMKIGELYYCFKCVAEVEDGEDCCAECIEEINNNITDGTLIK
jgi:predicted amidophosphoribosyltransferase